MFFVPAWITNIVLLLTFYMSIYQHVQLKRPNPVLNLQFIMMAFALILVVVTDLYNGTDKRLSMGFFAVSVVCALLIYRQFRYLPPRRRFE